MPYREIHGREISSGMSYGAAGCEFIVNELTIYIT